MFRKIAVLSMIGALAACHEAAAPVNPAKYVPGAGGGGVIGSPSAVVIYGVLQMNEDLKPVLLRDGALVMLVTSEDVSGLVGYQVKAVGQFLDDGSFLASSVSEGKPDPETLVLKGGKNVQ